MISNFKFEILIPLPIQHSRFTIHHSLLTIQDIPPGPSLDRARGPVEIPLLEPWQISLITFFGALLLGLIGWLVLRYLRTQKKNVPKEPPHSIAIAELNKAAQTTVDNDKAFATLNAQALRRYFAKGSDMYTHGKTTDEFIQTLETDDLPDSATRTSLANILHQCDQIKFAGVQLTQEERQQLTETALALLERRTSNVEH